MQQRLSNPSSREGPAADGVCRELTHGLAMLQFVNKDIVPINGPAIVNAAYKLWKQSGKQPPPQAAGAKWTRLSKAEVPSAKKPDSLTLQAEAVGKEVIA